MAEMEKEGRPPENKRSRKPAHPVKREINEEMKVRTERANPWAGKAGDLHGNPPYSMSFAENTMNELLGWYGYDKVDLRDQDHMDIKHYPDGDTQQHISVLKENALPKTTGGSGENSDVSPNQANSSHSTPTSRNGVTESSSTASTSTPVSREPGGMPIIVPLIPPPMIKPPADEDLSNVQIMCAWCQKVGVKRYSLNMGTELKNFCSEKCFAACRRAYFKRNKLGYVRNYSARDEDGHGEKLPQHSYSKDTPRLVFKTNSDVLVCDWCKHIRHTKEYLDFGAGERRLQFCSAKCLNQYKMDIFYKETQAALPGGLCNPGHSPVEGKSESSTGVQLLTPESWGTPLGDLRRKAPSPGGNPSVPVPSSSTAASPSETGTGCCPSSSVKNSTPRTHESPTLPPPPHPALHPPMGVPSGSPPMVMTPRGPVPLPFFMEHQMMQQMRQPFLRPPTHGPNSPMSNPMIPGIGPPQPPRTLGPTSSPMHRPQFSPHHHPSSNPNLGGNPPGMMPPHPGLHIPGFPFHPNMMPNGPMHMPPMMNFGMPSLAPLVPPPTLLVPYPVIVPLPVPIPIPIPFPYNPKTSKDNPSNSDNPLSNASGKATDLTDPKPFSPGSSRGEHKGPSGSGAHFLGFFGHFGSERSGTDVVDLTVKPERPGSATALGLSLTDVPVPSLPEGVIDLTMGRRSRLQQLIQRVVPSVQVKGEPDGDSHSPPPPGPSPLNASGLGNGNVSLEDMSLEIREAITGSLEPSSPSPKPNQNSQHTQLTNPQGTTRTPSCSPAASCNVIVNGSSQSLDSSSRSTLPAPSPDPGRRGGGEPANGELEQEALKENSCSVAEWEPGKRGPREATVQGGPGEGKQEANGDHVDLDDDDDHAYALPLLLPKAGCVIQPVPKPSDKTAIVSCSLITPLAAGPGSPELEPPLKRRCLRIRNQNK
ncbi:hypothetical protein UPYG_G00230320 [Umbra pygmaea]|uniref:Sine oculis-binding protein homolog n=1 Tax=Umbra pygmaea TaxID=75934 RepID=A0ABD0WI60_UMBPY